MLFHVLPLISLLYFHTLIYCLSKDNLYCFFPPSFIFYFIQIHFFMTLRQLNIKIKRKLYNTKYKSFAVIFASTIYKKYIDVTLDTLNILALRNTSRFNFFFLYNLLMFFIIFALIFH